MPPAIPGPTSLEDDPADLTRGWQRLASHTADGFCHRAIRRKLDAPNLAMSDSQSGPHAASVFTTTPVSPELSLSSPLFRVLLLRPLRLPLPLTSVRCRWAGLLSALLRASAGRATVALNVRLRGLNVDVARQDERRIEVIASNVNVLARWGGSQLAIDTNYTGVPLRLPGPP